MIDRLKKGSVKLFETKREIIRFNWANRRWQDKIEHRTREKV